MGAITGVRERGAAETKESMTHGLCGCPWCCDWIITYIYKSNGDLVMFCGDRYTEPPENM